MEQMHRFWPGCFLGLVLAGCAGSNSRVTVTATGVLPTKVVTAAELAEVIAQAIENSKQEEERVITASLDEVATTLQAMLRKTGLTATVLTSKGGDMVRLTSKSKKGQSFEIVLTREHTSAGEKTHVQITWQIEQALNRS